MTPYALLHALRMARRVAMIAALAAPLVACGAKPPPAGSVAIPPSEPRPGYPIRRAADGLHFMDFEGSKSKATIVEFAYFVALLEVPISPQGGDATKLDDHVEEGRRVLRSIRERFPDKPLRYVLSSHWHPHSLSSLAPFLEARVTLVTTRANFERLKAMLPNPAASGVGEYVKLVDSDSFTIEDRANSVVARRFTQRDYPATPTADYLYFELPKYNALHVACMYYRPSGGPVMGRELITAREHDVFGFIQAKGLKPASLIRLDRETGADLLPFADLERVMHSGISSAEITAPYEAMTLEALRADRGRLVAAAAKSGVPGSVFNDLAYESLGRKDLARALEFATLQSLVAPSSANGWDTLGEVYYLLGDAEAARTYDAAAKKLGLATAGESVWKEDQADFEKRWSLPSAKGR